MVWADAINQICAEVAEEAELGELPHNLIRKTCYRRLARERGWIGFRGQHEECVIWNIRDYFPRRSGDPAYMGHKDS